MTVGEITLHGGRRALVDDDDYERLRGVRWHVMKLGGPKAKLAYWYAARGGREGEPANVLMHREIMGVGPSEIVDHVNGDTLDNRRCNLRVATRSQNCANRQKNVGRVGYKGVYRPRGSQRYYATITAVGETYPLGSFEDQVEAALAYDMKAIELFGPFARPNLLEAVS